MANLVMSSSEASNLLSYKQCDSYEKCISIFISKYPEMQTRNLVIRIFTF